MNKELKTTFHELESALLQIQIQLEWVDSTITDLKKVCECIE